MDELIGESVPRLDAVAKVKGEARYPGDMNAPDQLYMKILFSERAHAVVRSIDTSAAEEVPGVVAVFTAKDVPVNEYGLTEPDQPVLCGPGSSKPYADHVRFVGDQVALVIAESEEIADKARALIRVEYEDLPLVEDADEAMQPDAVLLHPDRGSNVFTHYRIRNGNVEDALAKADVVVEGDYRTPAQEHAYLQPEAGFAYVDEENRVTVVVAGQWTHEDRDQIANALSLEPEQVRVIYPAIGGAFGGREDISVQIVLALAVWKLWKRGIRRPVKIIWSREESITGHHKRHRFHIHMRWGATREGKLVAADCKLVADGGAYMYTSPKVLGNATLLCTGSYDIPHVKVDAYAVYTNHVPAGAFRGFGGPQALFAAEMQMEKLAESLNMDPVELRMRNCLTAGSVLSVGTPLPEGVALEEVARSCAQEVGWEEREGRWSRKPVESPALGMAKKRGVGFALGFKNVGFSFGAHETSWAKVELHGATEIEHAVVYQAGAEVGQGFHTVIAQLAAGALGIGLDRVELRVSDTAFTGSSGSSSASRLTTLGGNAVLGAAKAALEKWRAEERPAMAEFTYEAPATTALDPEDGHSLPNFAYGYAADAVELEVDTETGQVDLLKVVCADDVGKAINRRMVEGQIEGAVVQAEGYALTENFIESQGRVLTSRLSTYLIPTVLDIPQEIEDVILETPNPVGPHGATGVGEMPFLVLAPAIAAALKDATGVWLDDFPLTPERILRALGKF